MVQIASRLKQLRDTNLRPNVAIATAKDQSANCVGRIRTRILAMAPIDDPKEPKPDQETGGGLDFVVCHAAMATSFVNSVRIASLRLRTL
jgi:hypothetical protein